MIADRVILPRVAQRPIESPGDGVILAGGCMVRYSSIDAALSGARRVRWLSARELRWTGRFGDRRRRLAWMSGRILAKRLLLVLLCDDSRRIQLHPSDLEILSHDAEGRGAPPTALLGGQPLDCSLSIAHTDTHVLVAVAPPGAHVGVDIVDARFAPSDGFRRLWFTEAERRQHRGLASPFPAATWAIKEAVYKAANRRSGFQPQHMEVVWRRGRLPICHARNLLAATCEVRAWRTSDAEVAALAVLPPCDQPRGASPS